ncbi:uncharacterized protein V6R79_011325 [Siganus canaliculatus]
MDERERIESLKPGDLIEIFRPAYQHWAVYIGNEEVVHLSHPNANPSSGLALSSGSLTAVVMRQRIQEVINGDFWRKNNLHDRILKPREQSIIVKEAISRVGEELRYRVTTQNCEHFATELRYGKDRAMSLQVRGLVLGILTTGTAAICGAPLLGSVATAPIKGSEPPVLLQTDRGAEDMDEQKIVESAKPGDLIKVFRGLYQHWMVYIGDGEVVHLTSPDGASCSPSCSSLSSAGPKGMVKRQKLQEVTNGDRCEIDNNFDKAYTPRNPQEIVEDAIRLVGEKVQYSLFKLNCEHFATMLRYLKMESQQVEGFVKAAGAYVLLKLLKSNKEGEERQQH